MGERRGDIGIWKGRDQIEYPLSRKQATPIRDGSGGIENGAEERTMKNGEEEGALVS
jgi:hypothetical protein